MRGYVREPLADAPLNAQGKFDVSAVVGGGMFYVTYESGFEIGLYREPYRGSVPIVSGEIGEDFAYYLAKSEQIPSAVMLGVLVRARESGEMYVEAAGGLMVQVMPGADRATVAAIEATVEPDAAHDGPHPRGRAAGGLAAHGARRGSVRGAGGARGRLRLHMLVRARGVARLFDRRCGVGVDAARG